jgi:hypothetical protein
MKKCLTFPFLFMVYVAFAQPEIHSITSFNLDNPRQKSVQLFDYQDNGLTVRQQNWEYKRVDSTPRLLDEQVQRFTINGQLVSQENRKLDKSVWKTTWKTDNTIDANGCQTERRYTLFDNNKAYIMRTYSTKTNIRCRISEETLRYYEPNDKGQFTFDSVEIVKKFEYDSRDSLKTINYAYFYKGAPNMPPGILDYKRRADGKAIEIYSENVCEFCIDIWGDPSRGFIEYDANGQVIMEKNMAFFGRYVLMDSVRYEYNAAKQKLRKTDFKFDRNAKIQSTETTDYAYYCDGLLKSETTRFSIIDFQSFVSQKLYTYTEGSICDKKDLLDFTISPNPAQFQAMIASEALSSADCTLTIYNAAGALIHTYKIDYRTTTFDFSTANLVSGAYLLRLTNDKNSVTKKLIVVH